MAPSMVMHRVCENVLFYLLCYYNFALKATSVLTGVYAGEINISIPGVILSKA